MLRRYLTQIRSLGDRLAPRRPAKAECWWGVTDESARPVVRHH